MGCMKCLRTILRSVSRFVGAVEDSTKHLLTRSKLFLPYHALTDRHRYFATMYDEPALNDQFVAKTPQWFSRKLPVTLQGVKDRVLSKR